MKLSVASSIPAPTLPGGRDAQPEPTPGHSVITGSGKTVLWVTPRGPGACRVTEL